MSQLLEIVCNEPYLAEGQGIGWEQWEFDDPFRVDESILSKFKRGTTACQEIQSGLKVYSCILTNHKYCNKMSINNS